MRDRHVVAVVIIDDEHNHDSKIHLEWLRIILMTVLDGVALKRHPNGASTLYSIVFVVYIMYEAVIMRIAQCYAAIFL